MEFFKKIRSKPAWMGLAGILVIALVLLVFLIPEKNTTMGETDVSQMNSGGVLENEDAGASEVSEKGTEESTADDKTDAEETSADETSGKKSSTDGKNSKKETAKETSAEKNAETSAAKKKEKKESTAAESTQAAVQTEKETEEALEVTGSSFSKFSGQFIEDGTDELVENVAAMLVTNNSDQFLDLATLQYTINGKAATFVVTGLPAGKSAWVLEENRMTISDNANFKYQDCVTSFKDGVIASSDKVTIKADGNMLTATNNTKKTLKNVFVYYKSVHTDGNFFGGITYMVDFGTLKSGESVESLAGHYVKGETKIVRIGWQE